MHKLAIPEWLYQELMAFERTQTRSATDPFRQLDVQTNNVTELVIPPVKWKYIQPLSVKKFSRAEALNLANRQRRLEDKIEKRPHPEKEYPTKKFGMEVLPTGKPSSREWEQEEYELRKKGKYRKD